MILDQQKCESICFIAVELVPLLFNFNIYLDIIINSHGSHLIGNHGGIDDFCRHIILISDRSKTSERHAAKVQ